MGFDCEAVTIIGLRLLEKDLKIPFFKPFDNCQHNITTFNYCPHCGSKTRLGIETIYQYINQFSAKEQTGPDSSDDDYYDSLVGHLTINEHVYPIYKPVEREDWIYITLYYGIKKGPRSYEKDNVVKISPTILTNNHLKEDLTSIHLWSEENYGIYTLIEYSY